MRRQWFYDSGYRVWRKRVMPDVRIKQTDRTFKKRASARRRYSRQSQRPVWRGSFLYWRKRLDVFIVLFGQSKKFARIGFDLGNPLYVGKRTIKHSKCEKNASDGRIRGAAGCASWFECDLPKTLSDKRKHLLLSVACLYFVLSRTRQFPGPFFCSRKRAWQIKKLFYNNMAPPIAYRYHQSKVLKALLYIGRILTLRKPFKPGQFETLTTMKQLNKPKTVLRKFVRYRNELLENVCLAIQEVPALLKPLKRAIRYSSRTGHILAFVHIDFNDINNGNYWNQKLSFPEKLFGNNRWPFWFRRFP